MFFFLNILIGQSIDSSYSKIQTDSWIELSYKPINDVGEEMPFVSVEEIPEFPGGHDSLAKFITTNLKYPESAQNDSIQGCVLYKFYC